jgi:hypothetical protein
MFSIKRMVPKESWLYRSGDIWLPKTAVSYLNTYVVGNDRTLFYLNYWHGMHFLSGVFFALLQLFVVQVQHPFYVYFFLHTLWEAWQLWIGMTKQTLRGLVDIGMDTCMGLLGCFLVLQLA